VLMLDNEYPPLGGGTGIVNQRLLQHWADRDDVDVDLVTSSRTRRTQEYEELTPRIRIHKVPVDNRNIHHSSSRELLTYAWRGWRYARHLARRGYDVCLAWVGVPAGGIAYGLWRELGLAYVVSLQGPDVPGFEQRYRWHYRVLTPFIVRVWRGAAAVTACSEQHRELAQRTAPDIDVRVIANGVDLECFCPAEGRPNPHHPLRLVCVGRLIERKGQRHLLAAVRRLRDAGREVEVVLVGTGDDEEALHRQTAELGLSDCVRFTGCVPHDEMPDLYRTADIFVLPSYNEGMSIALLEAMACGLPVIVTNTGGTRELVHDNGMVVPWADVGALARSIEVLACDDARRWAMGAASRSLAARYTWARSAEEYWAVCQSAAEAGRRPRLAPHGQSARDAMDGAR
jgi:phosphatidylinositol alpha-1,6-mannosyltransferase